MNRPKMHYILLTSESTLHPHTHTRLVGRNHLTLPLAHSQTIVTIMSYVCVRVCLPVFSAYSSSFLSGSGFYVFVRSFVQSVIPSLPFFSTSSPPCLRAFPSPACFFDMCTDNPRSHRSQRVVVFLGFGGSFVL